MISSTTCRYSQLGAVLDQNRVIINININVRYIPLELKAFFQFLKALVHFLPLAPLLIILEATSDG
jgi:hypothetical protein